MGIVISTIATVFVQIVCGVVVYTGRGLWLLTLIGFRPIGICAGSFAAGAQSYFGNLVSGSLISQATSLAMRFL